MDVTIRPVRLGDECSLFRLARNMATSFEPERSTFNTSLRDLLTASDACLIVAEVDTEVVGYLLGFDHLTFFANGRVAWVEEIAVEESCRRRRVGSALMKYFEEWASSRGSKLAALATRRAAPFYRALGYEESASYYRRLL